MFTFLTHVVYVQHYPNFFPLKEQSIYYVGFF